MPLCPSLDVSLPLIDMFSAGQGSGEASPDVRPTSYSQMADGLG